MIVNQQVNINLLKPIAIVGIATIVGLLFTADFYVRQLAEGESITIVDALAWAMVNWYVYALLVIAGIRWVLRWPLQKGQIRFRIGWYMIACVVFSALHTIVTHSLWFRRFGVARVFSNDIWDHLAMHIRIDFLVFAAILFLIHSVRYYDMLKAKQLKTSQLEYQLSQARLEVLQTQIQPHFLFNTLNTITALMYEDVDAASQMLTKLSDLLRQTLRDSDRQVIPLREEVDRLQDYVGIQRLRFRDRLSFRVDIAPESQECLVPSLVLQPLVENAVKHGSEPHASKGEVAISVGVKENKLIISVSDQGPGLDSDDNLASFEGIGLANVKERLSRLYGEEGSLEFSNNQPHGLIVTLTIPYRHYQAIHEGTA